jgi:hypothetical protein
MSPVDARRAFALNSLREGASARLLSRSWEGPGQARNPVGVSPRIAGPSPLRRDEDRLLLSLALRTALGGRQHSNEQLARRLYLIIPEMAPRDLSDRT